MEPQHLGDPEAAALLNRLVARTRRAAADAGLSRRVAELLSLRISQINGCEACQEVHTGFARRAGVSEEELAALPAWEGSAQFTEPADRIVLRLAEAVARIGEGGILADLQTTMAEHYDTAQRSAIGWIAVTISAYNRMVILSSPTARQPPR